MRTIIKEIRQLTVLGKEELCMRRKSSRPRSSWWNGWRSTASCPTPNFSAGGIATPADAALVMQLGAEAVFVGSGIFKSSDPEARAKAIVKAATHFQDPECSRASPAVSATP